MLHLLAKIPPTDLLQQCIDMVTLQEKSALLLYQDAVYLAMADSRNSSTIQSLSVQHKLYVLEEDHLARGLQDRLIKNAILINYSDFVELTIQHDKTLSW